jgi:FkbM family methyltransferase
MGLSLLDNKWKFLVIKDLLKNSIKKLPISFTRNQQYDKQTKKVIRKVCTAASNCIDVGAYQGEILNLYLKYSPQGKHHAFEPLPEYYSFLNAKYGRTAKIHPVALSNEVGQRTFNYVMSNPSYSGLLKRKYDRDREKDQEIVVETACLDDRLPNDLLIDFIKIDVEGAELLVLKGGEKSILRSKPVIVFEHGKGAADVYGYGPEDCFSYISDRLKLNISTMKKWLENKPQLTKEAFVRQFSTGENYYFIAYP